MTEKKELISRDAALDFVSAMEMTDQISADAYIKLANYLEELPSEPVGNSDMMRPKGHWETYKDEHLCSVCKGVVTDEWYHEYDAYNYCPWCGARMEEHYEID